MPYRRSFFLFIFCLFTTNLVWAQLEEQYQALSSRLSDTTAFKARLSKINKNALAEVAPEAVEFYQEIYQDRANYLMDGVRNGDYLFDEDLQAYLNSLIARIPEIDPTILLVSRDGVANAYSMGHGVMVLDIGLIATLGSSDQLAFVIAHEWGHDQLDHIGEKLAKGYALQQDKELKKDLKRARKKKNRDRLFNILGELLLDARRHSRTNELMADSVAQHLIWCSDFQRKAGQDALTVLDTLFFMVAEDVPAPQSFFDHPDYPFKSRWLREEERMFGGQFGEAEADSVQWWRDSLRTHPDCPLRIERLNQREVGISPISNSVDSSFQYWQQVAQLELIEGWLHHKSGGLALLQSLSLAKRSPNAPYLNYCIGRSLLQLYEALEEHDYDRQVPKPGQVPLENGKKLIKMLDNIRGSELEKVAYHFVKKQKALFPDHKGLNELDGYLSTLIKQ